MPEVLHGKEASRRTAGSAFDPVKWLDPKCPCGKEGYPLQQTYETSQPNAIHPKNGRPPEKRLFVEEGGQDK
jgi:hypothetical protein